MKLEEKATKAAPRRAREAVASGSSNRPGSTSGVRVAARRHGIENPLTRAATMIGLALVAVCLARAAMQAALGDVIVLVVMTGSLFAVGAVYERVLARALVDVPASDGERTRVRLEEREEPASHRL